MRDLRAAQQFAIGSMNPVLAIHEATKGAEKQWRFLRA